MATSPEIIDTAILASLGPHWTKVATVLGRAEKTVGPSLGDDGFETLAKRLEHLAATGTVLARGDLKQWRLSEVRLTEDQTNG